MKIASIIEIWDGVIFEFYNILRWITHFGCYRFLKKNKTLRNKHKGQRCFIVLNGPSIDSLDLKKIKDEIVICVNYMYKSKYIDIVNPNYYCWLDSSPENENDISNLIENNKNIIYLLSYKINTKISNALIYKTYNKHMPNYFGTSINMSGLMSNFSTVAGYAISCALYMGFSQIYICGLDFPPGKFDHFEDLEYLENDDPKKMESKGDVCSNYWQYTKAHYEMYYLNKIAKEKGTNIYNTNKNSYIRAFEFIEYSRVFNDN